MLYKSLLLLSLLTAPLYPMARSTVVYETDDDGDAYIEEDLWYGPGFYYGIWFDDPDEYWEWRRGHREYPSNRGYYNHQHPVHYEHEGHGEGGRGGGGHRGGGHR